MIIREWTSEYRTLVDHIASALGTDHCTGVPDFYSDACDEHDVHSRTHRTIDGDWLTKRQAAMIFKERIQTMSWFGRFSPMAQWRYWAVMWAKTYWQHSTRELFDAWQIVVLEREWHP